MTLLIVDDSSVTDWNLVTCCLFTYLLVWVYCQNVNAFELSCHDVIMAIRIHA